jgi:hypothetical protein
LYFPGVLASWTLQKIYRVWEESTGDGQEIDVEVKKRQTGKLKKSTCPYTDRQGDQGE